MTIIQDPPDRSPAGPGPHDEIPPRIQLRSWDVNDLVDGVGGGLAALALTWLVYEELTPLSGGLGFFVCWFLVFTATYWLLARYRDGAEAARERLAQSLISFAGVLLMFALVMMVGYVVLKGYRSLRFTFFYKDLRYANPLQPATVGGGLAAIVGSAEQVGLATLISVPAGVATALFLSEVRGRMSFAVRTLTEAMSGIPSILAALFVYAFIILTLHFPQCGFAASVALSISMLPTVTRTCEVVFRLVPGGLREAALALGGSEWRMVRQVLVPTARTGVVTAIILGIARVAGETAPNILDSGSSNFVNYNPFHGQQDSLPFFVFRLVTLPIASERDRAFTGAFVLVMLILVLFAAARFIGRPVGTMTWRQRRQAGKGAK